jgi:hypothetical protein
LNKNLLKLGFKPNEHDECIFYCLTVNCSVDDVVEVDGMHC